MASDLSDSPQNYFGQFVKENDSMFELSLKY